jgi:hypothetical protein
MSASKVSATRRREVRGPCWTKLRSGGEEEAGAAGGRRCFFGRGAGATCGYCDGRAMTPEVLVVAL